MGNYARVELKGGIYGSFTVEFGFDEYDEVVFDETTIKLGEDWDEIDYEDAMEEALTIIRSPLELENVLKVEDAIAEQRRCDDEDAGRKPARWWRQRRKDEGYY